ncbi:uncharacterized protein proser2 [Pholidichthys leucotaenia]
MAFHQHGHSNFPSRVNGAARQTSRPGENDELQFLSQEEQECIEFFENTIDSLEASLEEDDLRHGLVKPHERSPGPVEEVDGRRILSSNLVVRSPSYLNTLTGPKDQDIIDLVHPEPDSVLNKEPVFRPTYPDFQSMLPTPATHFEIKPRHGPLDCPLPTGSPGPTDNQYHPPGCIPTPVLIAQKIAENQTGGNTNLPSSLLHRCSLEEKPPSQSMEHLQVKHGPSTSAKPSHYPANINVVLGGKDRHHQSLANVNIHERQAQMLANLSGTSHPLVQENSVQAMEEGAQNAPSRSISFKDPTPDRSRMEALSKLGLNRSRAMSGGISLQVNPNSSSMVPLSGVDTSAKTPETNLSSTSETEVHGTPSPQTQIHVDRKPEKTEIPQTHSFKIHEDRHPQPISPPSAVTQSSYYPSPLENTVSIPQLPPPEVTSLEFNRFGGKSIVVNPSIVPRHSPTTSPTSREPSILPPILSHPSESNSYGGKSKAMTPAPAGVTRNENLPDILSSHISQPLPVKQEPQSTELNSYGGKSRAISPGTGLHRSSEGPAKSLKGPAPTPAPKPPKNSYHGVLTPQRSASGAPSTDHKHRSNSMFRPQGITVTFCGQGEMNESRKQALRKLGLLKDF